jgi:hypothetical protein
MSDDETTARRAAREARRAAQASRAPRHENGGDSAPGPVEAAREAVTAAAVGAAVGAVRAIAARQRDEMVEDAQPPEPEAPDHEQAEQKPEPEREPRREQRPRATAAPREGTAPSDVERAVRAAREQLRALNGKEAESVSSFGRTRDGWRVTLEVLELERIPQTTDVLGSYLVELDRDRNLVAYEQLRRYHRSEAQGG